MTQFEAMILTRLDTMTAEFGRLATAVGRLEERQIAQDDRLDELERTPPPGSGHSSRQYQSKARTVARDAGLAISGGTITAVFTALLNLLTAATPPAPPRAPAPTHVEAPR